MTRHRLALSAVLLTLLALVPAAQAQTWIGIQGDSLWNDDVNWDTGARPNSPTAFVSFPTVNTNFYNVFIQLSSVQAASLSFTNTSGNCNLTSATPLTLSSVLFINVGSGVTTTDTINLASIGSG